MFAYGRNCRSRKIFYLRLSATILHIVLLFEICQISNPLPLSRHIFKSRKGLGSRVDTILQINDSMLVNSAFIGVTVDAENLDQLDQPLPPETGGRLNRLIRVPRSVIKGINVDDDVKHVNRIPVSRAQKEGRLHGTSPPPDQDDEDAFESLEANREAFLEILKEHAEHPHRRRSLKRHSRMQLLYNHETHRYSIIEQQSDEW